MSMSRTPTLDDLPPAACRLVTSLAVNLQVRLDGIPRRLARENIHIKTREIRPIAAAIRAEAIRAASLDPDDSRNRLPPNRWPDLDQIHCRADAERIRGSTIARVNPGPAVRTKRPPVRVYADPTNRAVRRLGDARGGHGS